MMLLSGVLRHPNVLAVVSLLLSLVSRGSTTTTTTATPAIPPILHLLHFYLRLFHPKDGGQDGGQESCPLHAIELSSLSRPPLPSRFCFLDRIFVVIDICIWTAYTLRVFIYSFLQAVGEKTAKTGWKGGQVKEMYTEKILRRRSLQVAEKTA